MEKIKLTILANELENDHALWIHACKKRSDLIDYRTVDLTRNTWLDEIISQKSDMLLAKPSGLTSPLKQLYDERIYILAKILNYPVFPSAEEIFIYENKRLLSFWLKANGIPHPRTYVYYSFEESREHINMNCFPMVGKTNIGASGSGVRILKNQKDALRYLTETFTGKGTFSRFGPNLEKGNLLKRGFHYLLHPGDISQKLKLYRLSLSNPQRGFVIFQEFIEHNFEWRVVRIGDSFFAHKKLIKNEKASGSLLKNYENPPLDLLDYVKDITDRFHFFSQAIDLFEIAPKKYLVNEMQCIFGQSDNYQMLVDAKPGRYRYIANKWQFEPGDFCENKCFNLRVDYVISYLRKAGSS